MLLRLIVSCVGLAIAACSQAPAPVSFGGSTQNVTTPPPLPSDPPAQKVAKIPPLPTTKPAPQAEELFITVVQPADDSDLIARIEAIVFDVENAPEPEPVEVEVLPTETGAVSVITVESGDTLYGLARRLNVTPRSLIETNGLESPYDLLIGQQLTIPGTDVAAPEAVEDDVASDEVVAASVPEPVVTEIAEPEARAELDFAWPVDGAVISTFGPKADGLHNDGINIAAPAGTPVRASEDGVVAYAGDELRGYGNLVLVRHANGWVTAYAHNAQNFVSRGQTVLRGDTIASVGASGDVDSPQSHFELRRGTDAVDPRPYLN
tara:strand:+ start:2892 stop:3854 length:963 start_codon:yes stop_codon:yes gene_type:complete